MIRFLLLMVFVFLMATGYGVDGTNPGVPWPATDALGRELPMTTEVGLTPSENTELSASQLPVNSPQTQCSKVGVEKARGKTVVRE